MQIIAHVGQCYHMAGYYQEKAVFLLLKAYLVNAKDGGGV